MVAKSKTSMQDWLRVGLIRLSRIHFALAGLYLVYIIASDATNLITPDAVLSRWTMLILFAVGVTLVWSLARNKAQPANYYRSLTYALILLDMSLATFSIYSQRGMASRAVVLYSVAIASSALLLSRSVIVLTASVCAAAYSLAAVKYFVDFFNEGYRAELYIEVGFYCAVFFVLAAILTTLVRFRTD